MPESLAKLNVPRVRNFYTRSRLMQCIDTATKAHAVVWLNAPAGSGKTSLIAHYLYEQKQPSLWMQLDVGDTDLASFFYYVATALDQHNPRRKKLALFTPEYTQDVAAFARQFFRQFFQQLKQGTILVFDDFHCVENSKALVDVFNLAIHEIPEHVTLIVISRNLPPKPLVRHSVNNTLAQIGWQDMQLDTAEIRGIAAHASQHLLELDCASADAIQQKTGGWLTGVLLHISHITNSSHSTSVTHLPLNPHVDTQINQLSYYERIFDYFACELFDCLDEDVQGFLTQVIYFPKFTVNAATHLIPALNAKKILAGLQRKNFFISKKGVLNPVYEFHPLFRQFLLDKSRELYTADKIQQIKLHAAKILIAEAEYQHAASLLMDINDWLSLKEIINLRARALEKQGRHALLDIWVNAFPDDMKNNDAELLYWQGIAIQFTDPFSAYEKFVKAFHLFKRDKDCKWSHQSWLGIAECIILKEDEYNDVLYWIDELHSLERHCPGSPSLELRARITGIAFNLLVLACPQHPDFKIYLTNVERIFRFVPFAEARCLAGAVLCLYYVLYGETNKLRTISTQLLKYVNDEQVKPISRLSAYWGIISAGWATGEFSSAQDNVESALRIRDQYGVRTVDKWIISAAGVNTLLGNDPGEAQAFIQRYFNLMHHERRFNTAQYFYLKAWHLCAQGDNHAAFDCAQTSADILDEIGFPLLATATHFAKAQVLISMGDYDQADQIIRRTDASSQQYDDQYLSLILGKLVSAWCHLKSARRKQAVADLGIAFCKAQQLNNVGGGWWLRPMLSDLCSLAIEEKIAPEYTRRLIRIYTLPPAQTLANRTAWPFPIRIYTLGQFSVHLHGEPIQAGRKTPHKLMELLKAVVALGSENVSGELLAQNVWGDLDGDAAYNTFTTTLHRLRKMLGEDSVLYTNGQVSINGELCWIDTLEFEQQLSLLQNFSNYIETAQLQHKLDNAFALYKGRFLQREPDQHWIVTTRERIHHKLIRVIKSAVMLLEQRKEYDAAVSVYRSALELDIDNESFYQGLMRCSIHLGQYAEGMVAYQRCRQLLSQNLSVVPSKETELLRLRLQQVQ